MPRGPRTGKQSEQTRKKRSQLSRQRQGTNGKWESNAKKAAALLAKRKTLKLNPLFKDLKAKQALMRSKIFREAVEFASLLKKVDNEEALQFMITKLKALPAGVRLLKHTRLPIILQAAAKRVPAASAAAKELREIWREAFRRDLQRLQEKARAKAAPPRVSGPQAAAAQTEARPPPPVRSATPAARPSAARRSDSSSSSSSSSSDSDGVVEVTPTKASPPTGTQSSPEKTAASDLKRRRQKQARLTTFFAGAKK